MRQEQLERIYIVALVCLSALSSVDGSLLGGVSEAGHHHVEQHSDNATDEDSKITDEKNIFMNKKATPVLVKSEIKKVKTISTLPFQFLIPRTGFNCKGRAPGYYADMETDCRVYRMCSSGGKGQGFLCPQDTKFNQYTMVCDHARRVNCEEASKFYHKNLVIHEASLKATKRINPRKTGAKHRRKKLRALVKRPRLHSSPIFRIKQPKVINAKSNGKIMFAPLFERERQRKFEKFANIILDSGKENASSSEVNAKVSSLRNEDSSTRHSKGSTIVSNRQKDLDKQERDRGGLDRAQDHGRVFLNVLEDTPPHPTQLSTLVPTVTTAQSVPSEVSKGGKVQQLSPEETSFTVTKFRKDPEQSELTYLVDISAHQSSSPRFKSKEPLQLIGHVMSVDELEAIPNSPMVNISMMATGKLITHPFPFGLINAGLDNGLAVGQFRSREEASRSVSVDASLGFPLKLKLTDRKLQAPLVWISPSSLARSPMVNLRQFESPIHNDVLRDKRLEKALTMKFPGLNKHRFDPACLKCISDITLGKRKFCSACQT